MHKMLYSAAMQELIDNIKETLKKNNLTAGELATILGVHPSHLRQILSGARPLTEQLAKHINLVLNIYKSQTFLYTVQLPEAVVRRWVPDFDKLSPEEQVKAGTAVLQNAAEHLIDIGKRQLTPEKLEFLKQYAAALRSLND